MKGSYCNENIETTTVKYNIDGIVVVKLPLHRPVRFLVVLVLLLVQQQVQLVEKVLLCISLQRARSGCFAVRVTNFFRANF